MAKKKEQEKSDSLKGTIKNIQKVFGSEAIAIYGDQEPKKVDVISTGSLNLDLALGIRGFPIGRIVEIYGPEASGKTTLTLHAIAEAQKQGKNVAFIDAEHALDPHYATTIGVNMDELVLSQPDNGEQALEITDYLVKSGMISLVVIDSVSALTPKAEIEGEMGDSHMGLQARMMSQALRKLTGVCEKNKCTVIFINQIRHKIGVMFGNPETTSGGNALKFYATVRLDIRGSSWIKEADEVVGQLTKVKVIKNKLAAPHKKAEFNIMYGKGIDYMGEVLNLAVDLEIIEKRGSWYRYEGEPIGQGEQQVLEGWRTNPSDFATIEKEIKQMIEV